MSTILDITNNPASSYPYAFGTVRNNTNVTMDNIGGLLFQRTTGLASTAIASQVGIPSSTNRTIINTKQ
jgi:hypothetical protein